jgi:multidrug efflux system membrane fusion protein
VQGQIMQVHYKEGQMVRKGDPLVDIDPRPYEAALMQAEGQLARDKALLEEAQIDLKRYQTALSRNAIAQQTVQDQEQVVHQDEGVVKNDEGLVASARVNLEYCHITSPIDGRVGLRLVDPGNIVQATGTTALVVVTQLSPITVIFSVAEDFLPQIQAENRQGHQMSVDALDRTQETGLAHGVLHSIDNQVDVTTGTITLRAEFPNKDGALFPNQFVNAKLLLNTVKNTTLVPNQAIQQSAQGPFVYVVDNGAAKMQPIKTGPANSTDTSVSGVNPGDTVVTAGFDKVQEGSKIATGQQRGPGNSTPQTSGPGAPGNPQNPAPPPSGNTPANNKRNRGKQDNVTPQSGVNGGKTSQ